MNQIILQLATLHLLMASMAGIMLHETHLDSAITKIVANSNDVVTKTEISTRSPHVHADDRTMLEHLRSLNAGRSNAKRNKGENEKKYLIKKQNPLRNSTNNGTL